MDEWFRAKESKRERQRSQVESDSGCQLSASMLLHNIFPHKIVKALQMGKKVEPEHHDMVTIFFCDIVGFTDISRNFEPMQVRRDVALSPPMICSLRFYFALAIESSMQSIASLTGAARLFKSILVR